MSKSRWRWATRDIFSPNGKFARVLWARKPQWAERAGQYFHADDDPKCEQRFVTRAYFRKRFGRDLPPGGIRRLP